MKSRVLVALLPVWLWASAVLATDYSGTYVISGPEGSFTLQLEQDESGAVSGGITGPGTVLRLVGGVEDPGISGTASADGQQLGFVAKLEQNGMLSMELFPYDPDGNPLYDYAETLVFALQTPGVQEAPEEPEVELPVWDPGAEFERQVFINREELSDEKVRQLETEHKTRIVDGRYWYDAKCGAWGVEGGPTLGFILPQLDLPGPMPADISGGGTSIFINSREIHVQDQMALQQVFGVTIPGRYWLDAQGNLGLEGGPAIANLLAAIQAARARQYGSATGLGGTAASDGEGGYMFSGRTGTGKSVFWYSGM